MTKTFTVWVRGEQVQFQTVEQVEGFIDQQEQKAKSEGVLQTIQVSAEDSSCMLITVGGNISYTQYYSVNSRPPIVTAIGAYDDNTLIEFEFMGELSQIEKRYWIPIESARNAMTHYLVSGTRPSLYWNDSS